MKQAAKDQKEKALVCFDFDHTIVNSHYHNTLANQNIQGYPKTTGPSVYEKPASNADAVEKATNKLLDNSDTGIKNPEQLAKNMKQLIADGHDVAITSFSRYPDAIKTTLATMLTEEELKKVKIVVGFPKDGPESENAKTEHIELAMKEFNVTDKSKVILVDDSTKNVNVARAKGFKAVSVPMENKNTTYLGELNKEVDKIVQIDKQQEKTTTYDLSKVLNTMTTSLGQNEASKFKSSLYDQMKSDGIKVDYNKGSPQLVIKGELTPEQKGKYDKIVNGKLDSLNKSQTTNVVKTKQSLTSEAPKKSFGQSIKEKVERLKSNLMKPSQKTQSDVDKKNGEQKLQKKSHKSSRDTSVRGF